MRTIRVRLLPGMTAIVALTLLMGACGDGSKKTASTTTEAPTAGGGASAATVVATTFSLSATLTGAAEAPAPGDVDGSGRAKITLDPAKGEACYDLTVDNVDTPTAAHIHKGPSGTAGNIVIGLTPPTQGKAAGCVPAEAALVADIAANPSQYYVNVHNEAYERGAVRGQLSK